MGTLRILASYVAYLPLVYFLARRRIEFQWTTSVLKLLALTFALSALIAVLSAHSNWGGVVALAISAIFTMYTIGRISLMSNLGGPLGRIGALARHVTTKIGLKHG